MRVELFAAVDVDRPEFVGKTTFLEHDADLDAIRRRPEIELDQTPALRGTALTRPGSFLRQTLCSDFPGFCGGRRFRWRRAGGLVRARFGHEIRDGPATEPCFSANGLKTANAGIEER